VRVDPRADGDTLRKALMVLSLLGPLVLGACQNSVVSTATNVGLAAATVASPTLAPVTAPVLAARLTPAAKPAPAPAPAPQAPPAITVTTEAGLLPLINRFRASEGKPPLAPSPALNSAALAHALDIVQRGIASDFGSDGSTPGSRARAAGCNWKTIAQSIAPNEPDAAGAAFAMIEAPRERRDLMGDFTTFGEGRAGNTFVALFATGC